MVQRLRVVRIDGGAHLAQALERAACRTSGEAPVVRARSIPARGFRQTTEVTTHALGRHAREALSRLSPHAPIAPGDLARERADDGVSATDPPQHLTLRRGVADRSEPVEELLDPSPRP